MCVCVCIRLVFVMRTSLSLKLKGAYKTHIIIIHSHIALKNQSQLNDWQDLLAVFFIISYNFLSWVFSFFKMWFISLLFVAVVTLILLLLLLKFRFYMPTGINHQCDHIFIIIIAHSLTRREREKGKEVAN